MTDCERHTERNFNLIVMSPTVRHSGRSAFRAFGIMVLLSFGIQAVRHSAPYPRKSLKCAQHIYSHK